MIRIRRSHNGVVDILHDGQPILVVERDHLAVLVGREQRHGDVGGGVVRQIHGRGDVEIAAAQLVGQKAGDADGRVDGGSGRVIEGVGSGGRAGDGRADAETFEGRALVAGDESGSIDSGVVRGEDEGEGGGLVEVLGGDCGGCDGEGTRDDGGSHLEVRDMQRLRRLR